MHCENAENWDRAADVVVAFAFVHWVYSCTARALSPDRIVGSLAALARDLLLVEWVDPADPAILGYRHLDVLENDAADAYAFGPFLEALSARFPRVELLGELSPTRRIYLASREPLPDLSWAAKGECWAVDSFGGSTDYRLPVRSNCAAPRERCGQGGTREGAPKARQQGRLREALQARMRGPSATDSMGMMPSSATQATRT